MVARKNLDILDFAMVSANDPPAPTKDALRRSMQQKLRATLPGERAVWSAGIVRHLQMCDGWAQAGRVVAMFGGMATEPDLLPLLPWLAERGVPVAFFAIEEGVMVPCLVPDHQALVRGKLGVLEPVRAGRVLVDLAALRTVLMPGLAFSSANGARLGRGKGFYDRVLAQAHPDCQRIGVCFHLQMLDVLPCEAHDVPVHATVTERGWEKVM